MYKNGFTLVELIIVIVILGILAVTAAPRFIDLSNDANRALSEKTASALQSAVKLTHLHWRIHGNNQAVANITTLWDGFVNFNEFGFPVDAADNTSNGNSTLDLNENRCGRIWNALLDHSPSLSSEGLGTRTNSGELRFYSGSSDGKFILIGADSTTCTYALVANNNMQIVYDAESGQVTFTE